MREIDLWQCAIVRAEAASISQADIVGDRLVWLPPTRSFAFRADPFALWDDGKLNIFVEYFDYRERKGRIELLVYDDQLRLLRTRTVLSRSWHLSYPMVFRANGEIWMLPEARQSGAVTLYRALSFPDEWEPAATIDIAPDAVDVTPLFRSGKWWLFYARGQRSRPDEMELNIAFAKTLAGPWTPHPLNPVRRGPRSTRPAGTPAVRADGGIDLPVQDSGRTYGGAVRRLTISRLDEAEFEARDAPWLDPALALAPFFDGLHTLSAAEGVSLIDFKRVDQSWLGNVAWRLGKIRTKLRRRRRRFR